LKRAKSKENGLRAFLPSVDSVLEIISAIFVDFLVGKAKNAVKKISFFVFI